MAKLYSVQLHTCLAKLHMTNQPHSSSEINDKKIDAKSIKEAEIRSIKAHHDIWYLTFEQWSS
jgi:hypothetical protein